MRLTFLNQGGVEAYRLENLRPVVGRKQADADLTQDLQQPVLNRELVVVQAPGDGEVVQLFIFNMCE